MTTIYKKKLLKEIETIPDKHFKSLYKMIHYFKIELKSGGEKMSKNILWPVSGREVILTTT